MKEPVFVAFSTQKGRAGKTTLTVLMASYLYYVRGLKVLVVDCDYPQYSIKEMRDRDVEILKINSTFLKPSTSSANASSVTLILFSSQNRKRPSTRSRTEWRTVRSTTSCSLTSPALSTIKV